MKINKIAVHPVVSVALLLVVSVLAVISLQTWYGSYQSNLFSDLNSESNIDSFSVGVEDIIGEDLYINAGGKGLSIIRVEIDGVECSLGPGTYTNLISINVSDCLSSSTSPIKDVLLITEDSVISNKVYIRDDSSLDTPSIPANVVESNNNFYLLSNGIVDCSLASVGDRATLNGKNYTAVSNQNLSDMIESNNVSFYEEACTSLVDDMNVANSFGGGVFYNSSTNPNISHWDTSSVTDMFGMFEETSSFNQPLNFDTSSVTDMQLMFRDASSFNQPLNFDTSSVTNMDSMFSGAISFNQPLNFNTSSVTDMDLMFLGASSFNQPLNFDTSNVESMFGMFQSAISFNQPLNFNTSNVTVMTQMFRFTNSFNQPLNFDTSKVFEMRVMFEGATAFNSSLNFSDTSSVTDMSGMFSGATNFNQPLDFNTSDVSFMNSMFQNAISFNQPLNFNTSSIIIMNTMFSNAIEFNQDLSGWCVSSIGSEPFGFDTNTPAWNKVSRQPVWGSCP